MAVSSSTVGCVRFWPTGEIPPATYPVARSAEATSAIAALRPFLQAQDPALVTKIDTTGKALGDLLETYRDGDGFVLYPALTPADVKKLTEALDAFSEPVATVAGVVAQG